MKEKIFLFLILFVVAFLFLGSAKHFLAGGVFSNEEQYPPYIKGIYITAWTASSESKMDHILTLLKETELNAVIIDIKEVDGSIAFDTEDPLINELGTERILIPNLEELINLLHKENVYVIARIVVFKDNLLTRIKPEWALKNKRGEIWRDWSGNTWLDMTSEEVWDYHMRLAEEAIRFGFNEINFDYIRFPSDGNISQIAYSTGIEEVSKPEEIRNFFKYLNQRLKSFNVFLSADLFGLTMMRKDDMNIGQILEYALPYFDFVCPMVYPSHYPPDFEGYDNPADHPYEVIKVNLVEGKERAVGERAKIRPWLQDFSLGAIYDKRMIELQKQAVYDTDSYGWLLWNPSSRYTEGALEKSGEIDL